MAYFFKFKFIMMLLDAVALFSRIYTYLEGGNGINNIFTSLRTLLWLSIDLELDWGCLEFGF